MRYFQELVTKLSYVQFILYIHPHIVIFSKFLFDLYYIN